MKKSTCIEAQNALQKMITWTKKIKKDRQEREMAYKEVNLKPSKLKTLVKIMFASNYLVSRSFGGILLPWISTI
jgi:hypothetical protein